MYGFVHRKDLIVSKYEALEDGILDTIHGQVIVGKGDHICTNADGDTLVFSPDYVEEMKKVKMVTNPTQKRESPFTEEHFKLMTQACNLEQDESKLWGK